MNRTHHLKCWPEPFDAIVGGIKKFEIRKNDREYQTGDILILQKYDPEARLYGYSSGAYIDVDGKPWNEASQASTIRVRVTYILSDFGLEKGYVCMSIEIHELGNCFICGHDESSGHASWCGHPRAIAAKFNMPRVPSWDEAERIRVASIANQKIDTGSSAK